MKIKMNFLNLNRKQILMVAVFFSLLIFTSRDASAALTLGSTTLSSDGTLTLTTPSSTFTLPTTNGSPGQFLQTDGNGVTSWASIAGGSGGTVTNVSIVNANGISGIVTNPTTTPAITLTLGAITPGSVAAVGTVTGSNLSGTNTGDQIISDSTITFSDITTGNFSTTEHGFVPKGTNVGNFLRDDGTFAAVPSSQWITTGDDIYYNQGNVGIGTINPSQRLDLNGNMLFSSPAARILGDFSSSTIANRTAFQTSVINGNTNFTFLPNGTAQTSAMNAYNNSDPTNAGYLNAGMDASSGKIAVNVRGSGTFLPLDFLTNNSTRMRLDVNGNLGIGTTLPTAFLNIKGSTGLLNTAPLKFTTGTLLGTTEAGAIEYDGAHLYFTATNAGTRFQLDQQATSGANTTLSNLGTTAINASLLFATDNTFDIGAVGASRPRDLLLGNNIFAGNDITNGGNILSSGFISAGSASYLRWTNRSKIASPSDGVITLLDVAGGDFGRLQFGGATVSFPAIKRSGSTLQIRRADDSGYSSLRALGIVLNSGTQINDNADGIVQLIDSTGTTFSLLRFGGGTASFPALKRSGVALQARLSDDTAYTDFAASRFFMGSNGGLEASSDGVFRIRDNAGSDFGRLQFGGITSAFPSLKRSTNTLQVRLADDSGYAALAALERPPAGTATAGSAPLKFTSGTLLGTTEAGAIEYDGTHLYFTAANAGTRFQLDQQSSSGANTTLSNLGTTAINASLLFGTDNTFDIGAAAASRPRSIFVGNDVTAVNGFITASTSLNGSRLLISNFVRLTPPSDGVLTLTNTLSNDFGRLQFGGTTSAFPAIKRSGTFLQARLADDSAYASIDAGAILIGGSTRINSAGNFFLPALGQITWASSSIMIAPADGLFELTNNAGTDFGRLQFGGITSSFPSIKRSTTSLAVRLADDSADASITALNGTFSNNVLTSAIGDRFSFTNNNINFTGQTAIAFNGGGAERMRIVNSSGNVGIGVTVPTAVLHLKAGTATLNTAPLKFTSGTLLGTTEAGAIEYDGTHLYFTAANAGTRFQLDQQAAGSGANTALSNLASVAINTDLVGAVTGGLGVRGGTAANDDLILEGTTNATRTTSYIVMQPTAGSVGIGTAAPAAKLEVNGALRLSGTTVDTFTSPQLAPIPTKINVPVYDPGAFGQVLAMGIPAGTTPNTARVMSLMDARTVEHQPSILLLSPDESQGAGLTFDGTNTISYFKSSVALGFKTGGLTTATEAMRISTAGNVGIGTNNPTTDKLVVIGDIRVGAAGTDGCVKNFAGTPLTGSCVSDARLKTNISPITGILDQFTLLRPVTYQWRVNEFPSRGFGDEINKGLIAQDVEQIFPELVGNDNQGFKTVDYGVALQMLSIEAIKELNLKVDNISSELQLNGISLAGGAVPNSLVSSLFVSVIDQFNGILGVVWERGILRIANVITDKLTTKELCLEDVCITKTQLAELLARDANNLPTDNGTSAAISPTIVPEPVLEIPLTPESAPTPAPTPTPLTAAPESLPTIPEEGNSNAIPPAPATGDPLFDIISEPFQTAGQNSAYSAVIFTIAKILIVLLAIYAIFRLRMHIDARARRNKNEE